MRRFRLPRPARRVIRIRQHLTQATRSERFDSRGIELRPVWRPCVSAVFKIPQASVGPSEVAACPPDAGTGASDSVPLQLPPFYGLAERLARLTYATRAGVQSRTDRMKGWWRGLIDTYEATYDGLNRHTDMQRFLALPTRFSFLAKLSEPEEELIRQANYSDRQIHQAGSELAREGEPIRPSFIASGWACRCRVSARGRRQILGFLLPGDGLALRTDDTVTPTSVVALTTVETVDATRVMDAASDRAIGLRNGLDRAVAHDEAFLSNQVLRLGMRSSSERLLHLLLELRWRLSTAKLSEGLAFPLPLTNDTLAQALCVSPGKIEGWKRKLSSRRLASVRFGRVKLLDPVVATERGPFQPPRAFAWGNRRMIDGFEHVRAPGATS